MKRLLSLALSIALLYGCQSRNTEGSPQFAESWGLTQIIGRTVATRTTLDADGRIVRWAAGDSVGLFGSSVKDRNVSAGLVDSYDGSEEGLFAARSGIDPIYAYFPYSPGASCTSNTVTMTLPASQFPKNGQPDMRYDFKVASSIVGTSEDGYSATFVQKLSLLHFVLTPDSQLAGDRITGLTLRDAAASLSGTCTISLDDASKPLSFTAPSDRATFVFDGTPTLEEGVPMEGWLFVNPDVKKNDSLEITLRTSSHIATIIVTASKDYEAGFCYRMPLDMAYLTAKGKAKVASRHSGAEILALDTPGVYDAAAHSYIYCYQPESCQYSMSSSDGVFQFRIFSFGGGWVIGFSLPATLVEGTECVLNISRTGAEGLLSGDYIAEVLKVTDRMVWLEDPVSGLGFVLLKN